MKVIVKDGHSKILKRPFFRDLIVGFYVWHEDPCVCDIQVFLLLINFRVGPFWRWFLQISRRRPVVPS